MPFRLTAPIPEISEEEVTRDCISILRKRGYWVQRNPVGMYRTLGGSLVEFGPVGYPDYTALHHSYPGFLIEFKRPGKKLRPTQRSLFPEIQIAYRLAAVMIDSPAELVVWLDGHERRSKEMPR